MINDDSEEDDLLEADAEFIKALQMFFIKNYKNLYADIKKNIDSGNISAAHRLAHSLKGNAAQIQKFGLQKAALDIERGLKNGEKEITEDQLKILEKELKAVLNELELSCNKA